MTRAVVDMHAGQLQDAGEGFSVGDMTVTATADGVRIAGAIVNEKAVAFRDVTFKLLVRGESTSVFLTSLPSGGKCPFCGCLIRRGSG